MFFFFSSRRRHTRWNCDWSSDVCSSDLIPVNAGAFAKLQLLLPGETAAPGTGAGKTGLPAAQISGASFNATVNAVDANWNLINSVTDTVGITSSDSHASLPANAALVTGTQIFSVTLISDGSATANTSSSITVNAGASAKLQLLMPGETAAPGTASGKTGTATAQTAGAAFNVTVNAVDANWNLVNNLTDTVGITASDSNATLPAN